MSSEYLVQLFYNYIHKVNDKIKIYIENITLET